MRSKIKPQMKLGRKSLVLEGYVLASSEEHALEIAASIKPGDSALTSTREAQEKIKRQWERKAKERDKEKGKRTSNHTKTVAGYKTYFVRTETRVVKPVIIGITGGIGVGKSYVADYIKANFPYPVIDTDYLARISLDYGKPAYKAVAKRWPDVVVYTGNDPQGIDRKKLADVVFNDTMALRALEDIVHPQVRSLLVKEIDGYVARGDDSLIFLEIPPVRNAQNLNNLDGMLIVRAKPSTRIDRVMKRSGMSREEVIKRIVRQSPLPIMGKTTFSVNNDQNKEEVQSQITRAVRGIIGFFGVTDHD